MSVEFVEGLLLHVLRIKQFELVSECTIILGFQFFNQVESLHLNKCLLQVDIDMVKVWLQNESIQEAVCTSLEVGIVVMRKAQVDYCSHVVWSQVNRQFICSDTFLSVKQLCTSCSIFVPQGVIQRLFFNCRSKIILSLSKVSLQKFKRAQSQQDLRIAWILHICSFESIFDFNKVKIVILGFWKFLIVRVSLKPLVHVVKSIFF